MTLIKIDWITVCSGLLANQSDRWARLANLLSRIIRRVGQATAPAHQMTGKMLGRRGLPAAGPTLHVRQTNELASRGPTGPWLPLCSPPAYRDHFHALCHNRRLRG